MFKRPLRVVSAGDLHEPLNVTLAARLDIGLAPFDPLAGRNVPASLDKLLTRAEAIVLCPPVGLTNEVEMAIDRGGAIFKRDHLLLLRYQDQLAASVRGGELGFAGRVYDWKLCHGVTPFERGHRPRPEIRRMTGVGAGPGSGGSPRMKRSPSSARIRQ